VVLPHTSGPLGHSDGDVILHALTDALLGAIAHGDIGTHFPDRDPRWRGADSSRFLRQALDWVRERGLRPANVDITVVAESPRIGPHREAILRSLASLIGLPEDRIGLKAKSSEGVGPVGEGLAVACHAVVLLEEAAE